MNSLKLLLPICVVTPALLLAQSRWRRYRGPAAPADRLVADLLG